MKQVRIPDHTIRLLGTTHLKPRISTIDEKALRTNGRTDLWTDGPIDGSMDGWTDPFYRDAVASKKAMK